MNSFESLCEVGAALRMKVRGINAGFCLDFPKLWKLMDTYTTEFPCESC